MSDFSPMFQTSDRKDINLISKIFLKCKRVSYIKHINLFDEVSRQNVIEAASQRQISLPEWTHFIKSTDSVYSSFLSPYLFVQLLTTTYVSHPTRGNWKTTYLSPKTPIPEISESGYEALGGETKLAHRFQDHSRRAINWQAEPFLQ